MSVLMELMSVIKSVQTLSEATLAHVTLAIKWNLMDKLVMVSPFYLYGRQCVNACKCTEIYNYNYDCFHDSKAINA